MSAEKKSGVVVVTGGASGIGEACARLLSERGARVVVFDRDEEAAARSATDMDGSYKIVDIADADGVELAVSEVEEELGPVDALVHAAAISLAARPPEAFDRSDWLRIVDIDLAGTWNCNVSVGARMAQRGSGAIVNISSLTGMRSTPLHAYGPAKAGVISMSENLAAEWGMSGVRVNTVSPGWTLTPLLQGRFDRGETDPTIVEETTALGRLVRPEEIARTVAFLLSEEASAITGVNLAVDAGWLVRSPWVTYGVVPNKR